MNKPTAPKKPDKAPKAEVQKPAAPAVIKPDKAPKAEKPAKAEKLVKPPKDRQNGITRPSAGSKTGRVWEICDELSAGGERATRKEVVAQAEAEGINGSTTVTQYGKWARYHGFTVVREKPAESETTETPAESETPEDDGVDGDEADSDTDGDED